MPVNRTCAPGTSAPLDRLSLDVTNARSAPSATIAGISPGFCICAAEVEASSVFPELKPPGMCFAEEA